MANATINLNVIKSGYVEKAQPYTVIPTSSSVEYYIWDNTAKDYSMLYFGVEALPDNLKYKPLIDLQIKLRIKSTNTVGGWLRPCNDFDPTTLTYNNRPSETANTSNSVAYNHTNYQWQDITASKTGGLSGTNIKKYLTTRCFNIADVCYSKIVLGNGNSPYITVTYENSTEIHSGVILRVYPQGTVDNASEQVCKWDLAKASGQSGICMADSWEQVSANFYWREKNTQNWTAITVSDSTKQVTIPAYTFDSGKTYEFYVDVTDNTNYTSQTSVYEFATPASQITQQNCPTSGYSNPRNAITFEWYYDNGINTVTGGATTLHYRETGDQSWTDVSVSAGTYSITIPANTFSTATSYQWYLEGEDSTGYASQTSVYTFSTAAAEVTSRPIAPINTIQDKNEDITFRWQFTSSDNMPVSRCILQYKLTSESTWTTIVDSNESITEYVVEGDTLGAGETEWRVVPYNIDSVLGVSNTATFIAYGAPDPPVVYTDNKPYLTITWQAQEQESYEIMVGDELYGAYYGTEKEFTLPRYLEDGSYIVKVRTMGVYGLWSNWGETGATILNDVGEGVTLTAQDGIDVVLTWETEDITQDFRVYRDGVLIKATNQTEYIDRTVLGEHTYKVVNRLSNGNYSESDDVQATSSIEQSCISLLSGGDWLPIIYSLKDSSDPSYQENHETIYNHLAGHSYPSAVLSGFFETNVTYSAVFFYTQTEEQAAFIALFGKPVILKLTDGNAIVGIMDNWSVKQKTGYWTAYSFTLRRVEWEDFSDDTQ